MLIICFFVRLYQTHHSLWVSIKNVNNILYICLAHIPVANTEIIKVQYICMLLRYSFFNIKVTNVNAMTKCKQFPC